MRIYEIHGDTGTRLHRIWKTMKCRCFNKQHPTYKWYGAKGIKICEEWLNSYSTFKEWCMNNGYTDSLELDRIDVNGDYCPSNCRWVTHHEQTMNRSDTLYIAFGCERIPLRDFCKTHSINLHTVNAWRHKGILSEKIHNVVGFPVTIEGGRTREVMLNEDNA